MKIHTMNLVERVQEAQEWVSDCLGMVGSSVSVERAMRYVATYYPGGWDAFVQDCCVYTLP